MIEYNAILKERKDINNGLAIFKFKVSPNFTFKPGQWATFEFEEDGKKILRPYSIASKPSKMPEIELFIRLINHDGKIGKFTGILFDSKINDNFKIVKVGGIFTLDCNDKRTNIFVASGTGLAPFISILEDYFEKNQAGNFIIIHGVSYKEDLAYFNLLTKYENEGKIIKYIPTLSRPKENKKWSGECGRVENLINGKKIQRYLNEKLDPKKHSFYLCGHPDMIENINKFLLSLGFKDKEDIKFEKYWSTPKKS